MQLKASLILLAAIAALSDLSGCAGSGEPNPTASILPAATAATATAPQSDYQLSPAEQKLNCKQITGRMQIRILQIRDFNDRMHASLLSRGLHSAFANTVGTSPKGLDPDGAYASDLKMLRAYNELLAAKGCKSFNLDDELQKRGAGDMPSATVPAPPQTPATEPAHE